MNRGYPNPSLIVSAQTGGICPFKMGRVISKIRAEWVESCMGYQSPLFLIGHITRKDKTNERTMSNKLFLIIILGLRGRVA
jgi:hypothetical protein